MKKLYHVAFLLIVTLNLHGQVTLNWLDENQKIIHSTVAPENVETLKLYGLAGKNFSDIQNLEKLPNLKKLIFIGAGYSLTNDTFLNRIPKIEEIVFLAITLPEDWPHLKDLRNLKVLVFRGIPTPDRLEFFPGLQMDFLGIPGAERFPILKGYKNIKVLDLSDAIFKEPGAGVLNYTLLNIDTIHMDRFVFPPGAWATQRVKFRGIDEFYKVKYPEAQL